MAVAVGLIEPLNVAVGQLASLIAAGLQLFEYVQFPITEPPQGVKLCVQAIPPPPLEPPPQPTIANETARASEPLMNARKESSSVGAGNLQEGARQGKSLVADHTGSAIYVTPSPR
jgi:hypothetical protein